MSAQVNAAAAFMPSGDIGNKAKSFVLIAIVVLVIVIVIIAIKQGTDIFGSISGGIDSFLIKLGIKKSPADEAADKAISEVDTKANSINSPFNPTFYKTVTAGTPLLSQATLTAISDQIYDSVGIIYDDPEAGFAAIKQARNWAQVSQISENFNKLHSKDLYAWLKIKYDTTTQKDVLAKIVNYAFALPK